MTMLLIESFDDGLYTNRMSSSNAITTTTARTGSFAVAPVNATFSARWTFSDTHATFIVGFAFKDEGAGSDQFVAALRGDTNATTHISLVSTTGGELVVRRGTSTELARTDTGVLQTGVWHYIELYVTLSDSTGEVKLRVDGSTPSGWSDLTNTDTKNGGTATVFDTVLFNSDATQHAYDDVYIFNGAGTTNNDVIGDVSVNTIYPNANGTTSQLVGSDGDSTDNFQLVDETTPSSTDYVGSTSTGNKDTYNYESVSTGLGTIYGILVSSYAAKESAGSRNMATIARTSSNESTSTGYTLQTSYAPHDIIWETNPNNSTEEWSTGNLNSAEFGVVIQP